MSTQLAEPDIETKGQQDDPTSLIPKKLGRARPLFDPEILRRRLRKIPAGRMGEPDDYAGIIALLASEDGKFITGQAISVSGGMNMI